MYKRLAALVIAVVVVLQAVAPTFAQTRGGDPTLSEAFRPYAARGLIRLAIYEEAPFSPFSSDNPAMSELATPPQDGVAEAQVECVGNMCICISHGSGDCDLSKKVCEFFGGSWTWSTFHKGSGDCIAAAH